MPFAIGKKQRNFALRSRNLIIAYRCSTRRPAVRKWRGRSRKRQIASALRKSLNQEDAPPGNFLCVASRLFKRGGYFLGVLLRFGDGGGLVYGEQLAVLQKCFPGNDHGLDFAGFEGVDDLGIDVVHGDGVGQVKREDDEIGFFAAGEHHVARWVVHAADLALGEDFHVGVVSPDAVGGDNIGAEEFDALEILHGSRAVFLDTVGELFAHFGDMDKDGRVIFTGHRGGVAQGFFGTGVNGVGSDGGLNERIALPFFQEFLGVGGHFGLVFVVGHGEIDPGFAKDSAQAGGFGLFGFGVFKVIHVGERGGAAADHFGEREAGAPADVVFGDVARFGGEDELAEPVVEGDVVFQPAHQHHGDMRVPVDQAGDDQLAGGIDGLFCGEALWKCGGDVLADGDDFVAADGEEAVFEDAAVGVHRDDRCAFYKEIGGDGLLGRVLRDRSGRKQQARSEERKVITQGAAWIHKLILNRFVAQAFQAWGFSQLVRNLASALENLTPQGVSYRLEESKGFGKSSLIRRTWKSPLRFASTTGMSWQNSQMIWRQAPQGGVSVSVSVTTAMESNLSSPSLMALKMATRSAQRVRPYVAFSMLQPRKILPEGVWRAAPTLKLENLA